MIEILQGFPTSVIAFSAIGRVTKSDYDDVVIPKVKEALARPGRIRCYYELASQFSGIEPGALWEDFKLGMEHLSRWERIAVVTDVDWIKFAVNMFRFLVPGEIRIFAVGQASEARNWIASD